MSSKCENVLLVVVGLEGIVDVANLGEQSRDVNHGVALRESEN